jgi:hypothetical protein
MPASTPASTTADAKIAGPPGGPVPTGFVAKDLTFVSTRTGWLLGTAPCTVKPCTSIVRTTKLYRGASAGASWTVVATVPAAAPTDGSLAVIGFEDARTGRFAPGTNTFLSTADAGQTWATYTFR